MKYDEEHPAAEDERDAASHDARDGRKRAKRGERRRRRRREARLMALRAAAVAAVAAGATGLGAGAILRGRASVRSPMARVSKSSAVAIAGIGALLGAVATAGAALAAVRLGALEPTWRRPVVGAGGTGAGADATPEDAATAGDAELAQRVEHELFVSGGIPAGRVNVSADDGTVTLRGAAGSKAQATDIVAAASLVAGVRGVRDELLVPGGDGDGRSGSAAGSGT